MPYVGRTPEKKSDVNQKLYKEYLDEKINRAETGKPDITYDQWFRENVESGLKKYSPR